MSKKSRVKRYKTNIKTLALNNEAATIVDELLGDRSAAIICAGQLDQSLETLLIGKMVPLSKDELNNLFKGEGPLATFSAKIKICYALGFFNKETLKNLDRIRKIRNIFAHTHDCLTFDSPDIAKICNLFAPTNDKSPHTRFLRQTLVIHSELMPEIGKALEKNLKL